MNSQMFIVAAGYVVLISFSILSASITIEKGLYERPRGDATICYGHPLSKSGISYTYFQSIGFFFEQYAYNNFLSCSNVHTEPDKTLKFRYKANLMLSYSNYPTYQPTLQPTPSSVANVPSSRPTSRPTSSPTSSPSASPSLKPGTIVPTTRSPSRPTLSPTPSRPTLSPTRSISDLLPIPFDIPLNNTIFLSCNKTTIDIIGDIEILDTLDQLYAQGITLSVFYVVSFCFFTHKFAIVRYYRSVLSIIVLSITCAAFNFHDVHIINSCGRLNMDGYNLLQRVLHILMIIWNLFLSFFEYAISMAKEV